MSEKLTRTENPCLKIILSTHSLSFSSKKIANRGTSKRAIVDNGQMANVIFLTSADTKFEKYYYIFLKKDLVLKLTL